MIKIHYSILSYHISFLKSDNMEIGILFQNAETNEMRFVHTQKFSRIQSFDDELDIEILKDILDGITSEVTLHLTNSVFKDIFDYTRFYVNELKFSKVKTIEYEDFNDFIELTKKIHLCYDLPKGKRATEENKLDYLKLQLDNKNMSYNSSTTIGQFNDSIQFSLNLDDYFVKFFNLGKVNPQSIDKFKKWSFNADEIKDQYNGKKEVIFVYDHNEMNSLKDDLSYKIKGVLGKYTDKVFSINEFIEFISKL